MDPQRDTPLKRFGALWIGLFIILSFGVAALVVAPFLNNSNVEDEVLQAEYDVRLETKAEIDKAQAEQLIYKESGDTAQVPPQQAFKFTSKQLLNQSATASTQVVPGSATDLKQNSAQ